MQQQVVSNTETRVIKQILEAIVFEKLLPFEVKQVSSKTVITIYGTKIRIQSEGKCSSFGRIRLNESTIDIRDNQGHQISEPIRDIVLQLTTNQKIRKCLLEELNQTILLGEWNEG